MGGMAKLLDRGRLAVVQGVGYPNPDRSHFRSMEIWETASLSNDAKAARDPLAGTCHRFPSVEAGRRPAGFARRRPVDATASRPGSRRCPRSRASRVTGSSSPARIKKNGPSVQPSISSRASIGGATTASGIHQPYHPGSLRVERPWNSSPRKSGMDPSTPISAWPDVLELIPQIIKADFGTRLFYTSLDGLTRTRTSSVRTRRY